MKKNYLSIATLLLATSIPSLAQTTFPIGINGCIAHWDFNSMDEGLTFTTLPDVSTNGNNGTPFNITSVPGFKGLAKTAGKFDGSTSHAIVSHAPMLSTNNLTTIALIKFSGFYSGNCQGNTIIYKGFDHDANQNWSWFLSDHNYDNNCGSLNADKQLMNFKTANSSQSYFPNYSTNYILTDKWYFLASVYNGSTAKVYMVEFDTAAAPDFDNIIPLTTLQTGAINLNNPYDIYIGTTQNPPFPYWVNGSYDELVLYNRALSNTEIIDVAKHFYGPTGTSVKNVEESPINVYAFNKTIKVSDPKNVFNSVAIFDVQGRKITTSVDKEITLSHLASQILFVRCYAKNGEVYYKKVMID